MTAMYEMEKPAMIVAPVIYATDHSLVQVFQLIDFKIMQGYYSLCAQIGWAI